MSSAPGRPKPMTALQAALVLADQPFAKRGQSTGLATSGLTPLGGPRTQ